MKTIVFRVDSGHHIGIGHKVRCLTLARELIVRGCKVHFISKNHRGSLVPTLRDEFTIHELDQVVTQTLSEEYKNNYKYWLGTSELEDLKQTNLILDRIGNVDLVIIDHYSLSKDFETRLKSKKVMVIDDLCFREHVCHLLLNQNLGTEEHEYLKSKVSRYLLGPHYSLLRPEFNINHEAQYKSVSKKDGSVKSCLVFFGFGDIGGNCLKLANSLNEKELNEYHFTFLLNEKHRDYDALFSWAQKLSKKITIISHTELMSKLMMEHDFFIGAGGATSWERACLGMPSAVVELAENQYKICKALAENGWSFDLGRSEDLNKEKWNNFFNHQLRDKNAIREMCLKAYSGVDGLGAQRVVQAILDII